MISSANNHDSTKLIDVMENLDEHLDENMIKQIVSVYADKGYDAKHIRKYLTDRKIKDCIPYRTNSKITPQNNEQNIYNKTRYVVERFFAWLKCGFRKMVIRYERRAENYLGFFNIASFFIDSFQGSYNEKIRMALKWTGAGLFIYGVIRTDVFRKSIPKEKFFALESIFLLNLIKYGDIILNNDSCMEKFVGKGGTSASGMFHILKNYETNFLTRIFPLLPFTIWILKKYGVKIFLRNLDGIIEWNFKMEIFVAYAIFKKLKK